MGVFIDYLNDITGSQQQAHGSDGRVNVSARTDSRSYYNSRDNQEAYSLVWADATSADGDQILYWQNTDATGKHLVIDSVGVNSDEVAEFQLLFATGTATGGASATPTCLNQAAPRVAAATARTAVTSALATITEGVIIDHVGVGAAGHEEMRLDDRVRLGQNGAIVLKMLVSPTTPAKTWGVVFGYYE